MGLGLAIDGRRVIAGDAVTFDTSIGIGIQPTLRSIRRDGINHYRNGDLALVTGRILLDHLDITASIRQRLGRLRGYPGTILLNLGGNALAGRINDDNGVTRLPVAIDDRRVIRTVVVIAIEMAAVDAGNRCGRRIGVDREVNHVNRRAGITARHVLNDIDTVITVVQIAGGHQLPLAIRSNGGGTDLGTIVQYVDDGAGNTAARESRAAVVSRLAVGQITRDRANIISDLGIGYARAGLGSDRGRGMMLVVVLVGGVCRATRTQYTSTRQQRPQQETATLIDLAIDHWHRTERIAPQGNRCLLAVGQHQLTVEAFTVGADIGVHLAIFGNAIEL